MSTKEQRDQQFRKAEERERNALAWLAANHPHMHSLTVTAIETYAPNDGWITSADTRITAEVKIRNKTSYDVVYINTAKHFKLIEQAQAIGSIPILFDYCTKDGKMLVIDLSRSGVTHTTRTIFHRIRQRHITSNITIYPNSSVLEFYIPDYTFLF